MLRPALIVEDLRDRPTTLRLTDATCGYGEDGNPTRSQITSGQVLIRKWAPSAPGYTPVTTVNLPAVFFTGMQPVDINYPPGCDIQGDGTLLVYLSLFSADGIPPIKASYCASFSQPINTSTMRLLVQRNGVYETASVDNGATSYSEQATTDVLTGWTIELISDSSVVQKGTFVVSDQFVSNSSDTSSGSDQLVAASGQAVLLLSRTRRRLNRLAEKLVFDQRTPLPQQMADGLVWLRMYQEMAELELGQYDDASPNRVSYLLTDLRKTLDTLWLRRV